MLFTIFFKDHCYKMTPKSKNITSSSDTIIVAILMDGTPSQKVLLSGRE